MAVHLDRARASGTGPPRGWVRETKRGGEGCDVCLSAARADRGGVGREEGVAATADRGTGDMCTVRGLLRQTDECPSHLTDDREKGPRSLYISPIPARHVGANKKFDAV